MSADNWTTCPECAHDKARAIDEFASSIASMYGTVPVEQFDEARNALAAMQAEPAAYTFREDYEFYGADEGVVQWDYKGRCLVCNAHAEAHGSAAVTR